MKMDLNLYYTIGALIFGAVSAWWAIHGQKFKDDLAKFASDAKAAKADGTITPEEYSGLVDDLIVIMDDTKDIAPLIEKLAGMVKK